MLHNGVYPPSTQAASASAHADRPSGRADAPTTSTFQAVPPAPPDPRQPPPTMHTLRLSDPAPVRTQPARAGRKRKSPPGAADPDTAAAPEPAPHTPGEGAIQPSQTQHLPPPHALLHPHGITLPPFAAYGAPGDFSPGGLPGVTPADGPQGSPSPGPGGAGDPQDKQGRSLSQSKRAEQNRKAQRAFRERRDQHVKHLETRSALLDTALASADEANRRWEECRAVVDALRIENAQLRAEVAGLRAENASLHSALTQGGLARIVEEAAKHAAAAAAAASQGEEVRKDEDGALKK